MPNNSSEGKTTMNYENLEDEFLQYASIVKLTEGQEMSFLELKVLKDGIDIFKTVKEIKDGTTHLDLKRTILSMDTALFELEKELLKKDKEIDRLKQELAQPKTKAVLVKRQEYWYTSGDVMNPVCSACYDSQDKIVRLLPTDRSTKMSTKHKYQCPNCKTTS